MNEIHQRYLKEPVEDDLKSRMVFIGGPRQVGKTVFALGFLSPPDIRHAAYLNWDDVQVRSSLMKGELPANQPLIILDEIHKYARWRNLVKGFYDTRKTQTAFIITGSARLDHYRKGGDSLHGRYHYYRLHPFSLTELNSNPSATDLELLLRFGGFPEPLFRGEEKFWRRWQRERTHRVIYDDIRDLERVKEMSLLELLAEELPRRVGSPLSIKNLREVLEVAHETVDRWVRVFERMYYCFRIPPHGAPRIRAVKKEQKLYLWDWTAVPDPSARFENLVACQLLKYCHFMEDSQGYGMDLRFLRDTDKREVDFVVLQEGRPLFAVECKTGEKDISHALFYFKERVNIPNCYQVHTGTRDYEKEGIRVLPFFTFCRELLMP
ncbi:MAG: AAA family ATPase [Deltaproteobacteria bacterium]|nr:AAA family ATPase [Deltaproteobacteria bacterium]